MFPKRNHLLAIALVFMALMLAAWPCLAQDPGGQTPGGPSSPPALPAGFDLSQGPISISADKLVAVQDQNMAEFSGKVSAVQGDTVIEADMLRIWYAPKENEPAQGQGGLPSTQSLKQVQALGKVRIVSKEFVSASDEALYTQEDGKLVLTGGPAEVESGKNKVSGAKITRDRQGKLVFEGGVVARFQPEEQEKEPAPEKPKP